MQILTRLALGLSLLVAGSACADQSPVTVPEASALFKSKFGVTTSSFDDVARLALNPALRRIASNANGTSCAALSDPQPFQWCVETGTRTVKMYSAPVGSSAYSWQTVFNINADGTLAPSNLTLGAVSSVAGRSGSVVLSSTDLSDATAYGRGLLGAANAAAAKTLLAITAADVSGLSSTAPVQTVAGRTGNVTIAAGDVSGLAVSATTDTTNAANISSGTLPNSRLASGAAVANLGFTPLAPSGSGSSLTGITAAQVGALTPTGSGASLTGITPVQVGALPTASPTYTGLMTGPQILLSSPANPIVTYYNTGAGADNKYWREITDVNGSFYLQTVNDAFSTSSTAVQIGRVGNSATNMLIYPHLYAQGAFDVAGTTTHTAQVNILPAAGTGAYPQPFYNYNQSEAYTAGTNFFISNAMINNRTGGTGNRETLHIEQNVSGASVGEQLVGATFIGRLNSGTGSVFGGNSVCNVLAGSSATAECVGHEINTFVSANVTRKVGLQVIDQAAGGGSTYDAGVLMGATGSGVGYLTGIQFLPTAVKSAGQFIGSGTGTVNVGIDLLATTFTSYSIRSNGFSVTGSGQVNGVVYTANGSGGVTCNAAPTSAWRSVGGIVTAC